MKILEIYTLIILGQTLAFLALWCRTKNNANEVPRWFSDMWVSKLLLPPKIIRIFGPKTAIFLPPNMLLGAHIGLPGSFGTLLVGWQLVGCSSVYLLTYLHYVVILSTTIGNNCPSILHLGWVTLIGWEEQCLGPCTIPARSWAPSWLRWLKQNLYDRCKGELLEHHVC